MSAIPFDGYTEEGFEAIPVFKQRANIPQASSPHGPLGANGILAFRHKKSGVKVVMFSAPGPIVSGTIVVGTRPISNAGHPHTLEHIVFLGSHKYPVRGYLDNLACRSIADGTNAWTANDHTAYTCATAGFNGFANLMPCFLDHVLRPKINDASFASEVYHVRADGKEAGVVFCEMQAREHTEADITDRELRGLLLSGTPLSLESGGLCEDIRHLSNEEIVRFHHDQYCGANVTLIVGGSQIVPSELLHCVKPGLDDVSISPGFNPGLPQWQKPLNLQPLAPRTRKVVSFPCADTEYGTIVFGWRGLGIVQRMTIMAVEVLLHYLTHNVWSPMRQRFVETEKQVASDISSSVEVFRDASIIEISLEGVKHFDSDDANDSESEDGQEESSEKNADEGQGSLLTSGKVEGMVMEFFKDILRSGSLPGGLEDIHAAIKCEKESYLSVLESQCHSVVVDLLIPDIIYGESASLTIGEAVRGALDMFDVLHHENEKFWLDLLSTVFVQAPRVELVMVPDSTLADSLSNREKKALQNRIELFGKDELGALGKANEDRIASLKPGSFDSSSFPPIPSTENISRWPYSISQTERSFCVAQSVKVDTDLVHCTLFFDMSDLPISKRIFLPLVCDLMLCSDIWLADGCRISYRENARALDRITISTHSAVTIGSNGLADNTLAIHFVTTPKCFDEASKLILLNVFQTEVTAERVSVVAQSLLADSTSSMRDGSEALSSMAVLLPYLEAMKREGCTTASNMFNGGIENQCMPNFMFNNCIGNHRLFSFLSEEFTRTEGSKDCQEATLQTIQSVVDCLRQRCAEQVFIQVAARDPEPAEGALARHWSKLNSTATKFSRCEKSGMHANAISRRSYPSLNDLLCKGTVARVAGIGGVETTCINVGVDLAMHEGHADWSAVTVLVEMLSRMEGPLSDAVRANGLAYGAYLMCSAWLGQLRLVIHDSSSPTEAWDAVCEVLERFRGSLGEEAVHSKVEVELDTAKATTLFRINQKRATPGAIMYGAVSRTADGLPASPLADRTVEEKVESVCLHDLARAYDLHVRRLLEDSSRLFVVTCGSGATEETVRAFRECNNGVALTACTIESLYPPFVDEAVERLRSASKL